jgi:hypothetical protein
MTAEFIDPVREIFRQLDEEAERAARDSGLGTDPGPRSNIFD